MQLLISAFQFIFTFGLVILVFNLIIVVHELGHFLAARWRGLRVDKFQIWFGKPIWKKTINGVQYGLGTIPAGGFVALPQMAPMELVEGKRDENTGEPLTPISPLDKIIVAFAGPLFSFLLAVVLSVFVWMIGYPASKASNSTTIGVVLHDSGADKAGLKPGDEILEVAGKPVNTFGGMVDSVKWAIISSRTDDIEFVYQRDGKVETTSVSAPIPKPDPNVSWTKRLFKRPDVRRAGIGPAGPPIIVGDLKQDGPGELAGLQEGDLITHLNGEKLYDFFQIQNFIMAEDPASLELTVEREGELQTVTLLPREPEKLNSDPAGKRHGIKPLRDELRPEDAKDTVSKHVPPHVQINATLKTMWNTLSAVFSPNTGITATHLSAAPGILNLYFNLLASSPEGWKLVLWFSVLLNVNLAIMNLLPIPILDGGHITMALIEGISRRPISLRVLEVVNAGCALLLIGFMLFLSLYDTRDIVQQNQRYLEHSFEPISGSATP